MDKENDIINTTKKKHFVKLHEKIQNKYNEMQRRLEKSKSIDSMSSINEEIDKYGSISDLSVDDVFVQNTENIFKSKHQVIVEDVNVNKQEVTYVDVGIKEVRVSESESSVIADLFKPDYVADDKDTFQNGEFYFNELSISSELLNEIEKKNEETASLSSKAKTSFRNRIESRISAVRERRREAKERNLLNKSKKKEIVEEETKIDKFIFSNSTKSDIRLREKRSKLYTVTIALIEVTGLEIDADEGLRSLQCRFKLGVEKFKSKQVKNVMANNAKWQEIFNINVYDEYHNQLDIVVLDLDKKELPIGSAVVDIQELENEKTHAMKITLKDGFMAKPEIFLLLTITGTTYDGLLTDINSYMDNKKKLEEDHKEYAFYQLKNFSKIGRLSVIVYGAKGLAGSDCFCNLKLINERRQTHTEYKTNEPNWMKAFTFDVTDITSTLQIAIYDEKKYDEIGRISIPLLDIMHDDKVWYALKDETLKERAKGNNPRILLEMNVSWNIVKASARVIKPKELDFLEMSDKFDRKLFFRNIARAKVVVMWTFDFIKTLKTCFEWESRKANTIWLIFWLLFNWFFRPWMVFLLLLMPFIRYRPKKYFLSQWTYNYFKGKADDTDAGDQKVQKTTLRKKINTLQDVIYTVQNFIGTFASLGERVKNLCNFSVPYISFLTIFFIIAMAIFVFLIPVNYILIAWGIKKYVRKIINPNRVSHSEVMDLISRVPDDDDLIGYDKLPLDRTSKHQLEEDEEDPDILLEEFFVKQDNDLVIGKSKSTISLNN